jgi:hypothetical protein
MVTVFEDCISFLWAKGLNAQEIIQKRFLFTVGSVCRVNRFTSGGKCFANDEGVETEVRTWPRQRSKDFYAAGFDAPAFSKSTFGHEAVLRRVHGRQTGNCA